MSLSKINGKFFLGIGSLYTSLIFVWLVLSKSLSSEIFILNYSLARFVMILVIGFILSLFLFCFLFYKKWPFLESPRFRSFFLSKINLYIFFLFFIISIILIVCTGLNFFNEKNIYFERGFPLLLESFFISAELIIGFVLCGGEIDQPILNILLSFKQLFSILKNTKRAKKHLIILIGLWGVLIVIFRLIFQFYSYDTPKWFPISMLYLTGFHKSGVLFLVLFWILLFFVIFKINKIKEFVIIFASWALIVLGNLMQGGFDKAFLKPFYSYTNQYYADALLVQNWGDWLAAFNANQQTFTGHTQTHPAFAVLLHNIFLTPPANNQVTTLAIGIGVLSLCAIPLFMVILRLFQVDLARRKYILLLFSIIPAINIYSIICLDGVVLTTSTIFLLGLIILLRKPEKKILGIALLVIGFISTSLLNYGSLFLLGAGGLVSLYEIIKSKKASIFIGLVICVVTLAGLILLFKYGFHYDYIQSFQYASSNENILNINFIYDFGNYGLTRLEDISEILFFLSFPTLAILTTDSLKIKNFKNIFKNDNLMVTFSGIVTLLFVFLAGTYQTGETARSCLFIFPFLFLLLLNKDNDDYLWMIILAAIQTSVMQICFGYYW